MTQPPAFDPARLPGVLGEIADVAGEEAALTIAKYRGGTQVYIPPEPDLDHWLCRLVGRDAARAICEQLTCGVGPRRVDLPLGPTGHVAKVRATVDRMIREDRSERDISLATGYTIRAVRRRRAMLGITIDDPQGSLF